MLLRFMLGEVVREPSGVTVAVCGKMTLGLFAALREEVGGSEDWVSDSV